MKLKKLLPYEQYILSTKLSVEEVMKRLQENTESKKIRIFSFLSNNPAKPYEGSITGNSFKISRIIRYRNSFLPVITGQVNSFVGKTEIDIKMKLHTIVLVFICFWLGIVGIGCIGVLAGGLMNITNTPVYAFILPFVMFLFGWLLTYFAFKKESKISKKFLAELLEGEETAIN